MKAPLAMSLLKSVLVMALLLSLGPIFQTNLSFADSTSATDLAEQLSPDEIRESLQSSQCVANLGRFSITSSAYGNNCLHEFDAPAKGAQGLPTVTQLPRTVSFERVGGFSETGPAANGYVDTRRSARAEVLKVMSDPKSYASLKVEKPWLSNVILTHGGEPSLYSSEGKIVLAIPSCAEGKEHKPGEYKKCQELVLANGFKLYDDLVKQRLDCNKRESRRRSDCQQLERMVKLLSDQSRSFAAYRCGDDGRVTLRETEHFTKAVSAGAILDEYRKKAGTPANSREWKDKQEEEVCAQCMTLVNSPNPSKAAAPTSEASVDQVIGAERLRMLKSDLEDLESEKEKLDQDLKTIKLMLRNLGVQDRRKKRDLQALLVEIREYIKKNKHQITELNSKLDELEAGATEKKILQW